MPCITLCRTLGQAPHVSPTEIHSAYANQILCEHFTNRAEGNSPIGANTIRQQDVGLTPLRIIG